MFDSILASAIILISIDFLYLQLIKGYFTNQIQKVQGSVLTINYVGVASCYILLIAGINYFIINPRRSIQDAFLLGIIIYGVYETTNYALLKNWALLTVFIDTLWGGILFAATTYTVNLLLR
jgi:uncharacterized membrane protein